MEGKAFQTDQEGVVEMMRYTWRQRKLLNEIAANQMSFFDDGILPGSDSWGDIICEEMGSGKTYRSILSSLVRRGVFVTNWDSGRKAKAFAITQKGYEELKEIREELLKDPEVSDDLKAEIKRVRKLDNDRYRRRMKRAEEAEANEE